MNPPSSGRSLDDCGFSTRLAISNIVSYFEHYGNPGDSDSDYMRAAHQLYLLIKSSPQPTQEIILEEYNKLQKIPLTYVDILSLYG
jgi:hypothetical protein